MTAFEVGDKVKAKDHDLTGDVIDTGDFWFKVRLESGAESWVPEALFSLDEGKK